MIEHPIINPWFIYLLGVWNNLIYTIKFCLGFCLILMIADYVKSTILRKEYKLNKGFIAVVICLTILLTFLPSRNTLIGIYAAKNITIEQVIKTYHVTKSVGKDLREYTINFIKDVVKAINLEKEGVHHETSKINKNNR